MHIDNIEYQDLEDACQKLGIERDTLLNVLLNHGDFSSPEIIKQINKAKKEAEITIAGKTYQSLVSIAHKYDVYTQTLKSAVKTYGTKSNLVIRIAKHHINSNRAWYALPVEINGKSYRCLDYFAKYAGLAREQVCYNLREYGPDTPKMYLMNNKRSRHSIQIADQVFNSKNQIYELYDLKPMDFLINSKLFGLKSIDALTKTPDGDPRFVKLSKIKQAMPMYLKEGFKKYLADNGLAELDKFDAKYMYAFYEKAEILK